MAAMAATAARESHIVTALKDAINSSTSIVAARLLI
jgi:hypothetical protein